VHLKVVKVGITTEKVSDILGGLSDGDQVVVDGTDRLVEGATVRVRKAGELDNNNPTGLDALSGDGSNAATGGDVYPKGGGKGKGKGKGKFKKDQNVNGGTGGGGVGQ
jgi:hypothetical protein